MLLGIKHWRFRVLGRTTAGPAGVGVLLFLARSVAAEFESGVYQTVPGATVVETGDNVPNRNRVVPRSATITFDFDSAQPSLTAVIHDAVLEGGSSYADFMLGGRQQPFELTLHSSSGARFPDGSYWFTGDYLKEICPSGTQYIFDWNFSTTADGHLVWTGHTYWAGGHIWVETISGITMIPEPGVLQMIFAGALLMALLSASRGI